MYVERPKLEKSLLRSLEKQTNTLIFGESGNGKSWLYKKVLQRAGLRYIVANCANASRQNSVTKEICNAIADSIVPSQDFSDFDIEKTEPLYDAFKLFAGADENKKIIVLDNLESIFSKPDLMEELANIIILLDDERYGKFNINFLIVGVPNGILDYYAKTVHLDSVANRLEEMDKVGSLSEAQVCEIIGKGFEQLEISLDSTQLSEICEHTFYATIGIAQRVHEYCEQLAYEIEDSNRKYSKQLLSKADLGWLKKGLRKSYSVIQHHLNSRDTTVARRNQVIYSIGQLKSNQFDSNTIDALIRDRFPATVASMNMGIGSILTELSRGDNPILTRNNNTNEYTVRDPRYVMCIRLMLYIDPTTRKIEKRKFLQ
jgi:hypothetical protein